MKHTLLAAFLLAGLALSSPAGLFDQPASPDASAEAASFFSAETQPAILEADFTQSRSIAGFSRPMESSGTFLFSRLRGACWITRDPVPGMQLISGNEVLHFDSRGKSMRIPFSRIPHLAAFSGSLNGLFAGSAESLPDAFEVYVEPLEPGMLRIGLIPKDPATARLISRITIEGRQGQVETFLLEEPAGDRTLIRFSGHRAANGPIPETWHDAFPED